MKTLKHLFFLFFVTSGYLTAGAQENAEPLIRRLEQMEVEAVLKGDTLSLFKTLWAPEFIVNNPANIVVAKSDVVQLIRLGKLDYESFQRIIEKVSIIENTAIVMGREEIKPNGVTDHSGKNLTRRFTNVWMRRNGAWQMVARQATISSVK